MRMSDWSSDVCSSDLRIDSSACAQGSSTGMPAKWASSDISTDGTASSHATQCAVARLTTHSTSDSTAMLRSEERRVGKECVSTCSSRSPPHPPQNTPTPQPPPPPTPPPPHTPPPPPPPPTPP